MYSEFIILYHKNIKGVLSSDLKRHNIENGNSQLRRILFFNLPSRCVGILNQVQFIKFRKNTQQIIQFSW